MDKTEPLEVEHYRQDHYWEDIKTCAACGEDFEIGDKFTWEPYELRGRRYLDPVHDWCAVKNGFVLAGVD